MQRKALAQIPLILGLLVMAIAIPVATKLVQENQDSRNQAAGCAGINQSCSTRPCCAGLTCADESSGFSSPRCISNVNNCPQGHRKCEGNNQYYCNAGNWVLEKACGSLGCDGDGCRAPACSGTETRCNDSGNQVLQCNNGVWKLLSNCPYGCINGACIENCSLLTNRPDNCKCTSDSQCKSKKCSGGVCKPVGPVITGVVPTGDPGPRPSDKCPGAQACPDETGRILRDCKKPDSDGTSRDIICNTAGQKDTCGGKDYCCPTAGGKWTIDMIQCPTGNCTQCSNNPEAKRRGDADCSGFTNLTDYSIWKEDYVAGDLGTSIKNTWQADFNCDGKVDLVNDYLIWKNYYIKTLQ